MNNVQNKTLKLVYAAMIGAIYAVLTIFLAPLSYGPVQCRISEALTILPFFSFFPVWGLTAGCLVANLLSPFGVFDIVLGTLATFIAAFITYLIGKSNIKHKRYLAPLPAVIFNGILVSIIINISLPKHVTLANLSAISIDPKTFIITALWVAIGEFIPCYVLGLPLILIIEKNEKLKKYFKI